MSDAWPVLRTALLLLLSNLFMTVAWYGHLRFKQVPLVAAIAVSWLIALPEYALQVPANRLGHGPMSAYQLKVLQECIALGVFVVVAWAMLGERMRWNHFGAFLLLVGAVALAFRK